MDTLFAFPELEGNLPRKVSTVNSPFRPSSSSRRRRSSSSSSSSSGSSSDVGAGAGSSSSSIQAAVKTVRNILI